MKITAQQKTKAAWIGVGTAAAIVAYFLGRKRGFAQCQAPSPCPPCAPCAPAGGGNINR